MIANIWVKIVTFLAVLTVLTVLSMRAYDWAYDNGVTDQKLISEAAKNKRLDDTNKALIAERNKLAKLEVDYAQLITANSDQYQKGLKDGQLKKANVIARINDGSLKLRDNHATAGVDCFTSNIVTSDTSSGGRDATPRGELSRETAEFLISLVNEADDIVRQLSACQAGYAALHLACSPPRQIP